MRCHPCVPLIVSLLLAGCAWSAGAPSAAPTATATPAPAVLGTPSWDPDRMQRPQLPAAPEQADLGALDYYLICMACHGDRGQGLTVEWRMAWGDDYNCWKSKCHASNHPPEGFDLPRTIPPVFGPGTLATYRTAAELNDKVLQTMPWWNPGSLSEAQAWTLTAHLLHVRGELPDDLELNDATAGVVRLHGAAVPRGPERLITLATAATILLGALAFAAWRSRFQDN